MDKGRAAGSCRRRRGSGAPDGRRGTCALYGKANAAGTLVVSGLGFGGFSIGADVEGLDFLAPVENGLSGFFELGRNGHGDFAKVNFAGRAGNRDEITTFYGVAVVIINPRCTNQCPNQP